MKKFIDKKGGNGNIYFLIYEDDEWQLVLSDNYKPISTEINKNKYFDQRTDYVSR